MAENLVMKLDDHHKKLQAQFKSNNSDKKLAKDLETFLNYVVYEKDLPNKRNTLSGLMDQALIDDIRKDPRIIALFKGQIKGVSKGVAGEQAFAAALLKIIQHKASAASPEGMKKIEEQCAKAIQDAYNNQGVIIGGQMATIINEVVHEENKEEIQAELIKEKKGSIRKYTEWDAKMGKIDIDMTQIELEGNQSPLVKKLLKITASVKNYKDFRIKLESVNRKKAYLAIMNTLYPNKTSAEINSLFSDYYETKTKHSVFDVDSHLGHMMSLYALTGYGQTYITANALEKKYATFLMYNNTQKEVIKIYATHSLIQDSLFNDSKSKDFAGEWSKSKPNIARIYLNLTK